MPHDGLVWRALGQEWNVPCRIRNDVDEAVRYLISPVYFDGDGVVAIPSIDESMDMLRDTPVQCANSFSRALSSREPGVKSASEDSRCIQQTFESVLYLGIAHSQHATNNTIRGSL